MEFIGYIQNSVAPIKHYKKITRQTSQSHTKVYLLHWVKEECMYNVSVLPENMHISPYISKSIHFTLYIRLHYIT